MNITPTRNNLLQSIVTHIIQERGFHTEYQPIVRLNDLEVFGYEALARFSYLGESIGPEAVFQTLHGDLEKLNLLENMVTEKQLRAAPPGKKIFINYDPHSAVYNIDALENIFEQFADRDNLVFELIEDTHELHEEHREELIAFLKSRNSQIAVDDFGKQKSFFSFQLMGIADYIKLDVELFALARARPNYFEFIFSFVQFIHSQGKSVILEGVEDADDLKKAKLLEVDFVQGFYFRNGFLIGD